jgi:hypothetical protein
LSDPSGPAGQQPAGGDKFDAVREVVKRLKDFSADDQIQILKWACDALHIRSDAVLSAVPQAAALPGSPAPPEKPKAKDLKTFVEEKNPQTHQEFAAVVAYYHAFVAPEGHRKELITAEDIRQACRQAVYKHPSRQILHNAYKAGLFDKSGRGAFKLNTVGENLVAMVLPKGAVGGGKAGSGPRESRERKKKAPKTKGKRRKVKGGRGRNRK